MSLSLSFIGHSDYAGHCAKNDELFSSLVQSYQEGLLSPPFKCEKPESREKGGRFLSSSCKDLSTGLVVLAPSASSCCIPPCGVFAARVFDVVGIGEEA